MVLLRPVRSSPFCGEAISAVKRRTSRFTIPCFPQAGCEMRKDTRVACSPIQLSPSTYLSPGFAPSPRPPLYRHLLIAGPKTFRGLNVTACARFLAHVRVSRTNAPAVHAGTPTTSLRHPHPRNARTHANRSRPGLGCTRSLWASLPLQDNLPAAREL